MSFPSDKIDPKDLLLRLEGQSSLLSNQSASLDKKNISAFAEELSSALSNLSGMENSEKLRQDAIANGKAIIKNWHPPTDEQIDKIFMSMRKELSSGKNTKAS
ncbi:MAG: hypothetical protein A2X49_09635 [Lentisphaerae bacterium GWF2_52_8]|nr:MAG: hypothetical protein A2X49_09635 [Lentisphaerae bacterium GWF2_52_8]